MRLFFGEEPVDTPESPDLTRAQVARLLASQDESCDLSRVSYYATLEALATTVTRSTHWALGEVFVCALDADRYIVMKQVAPSSCEMLVLSNVGFCDVISANRYGNDELVTALRRYTQS